MIELTFPDVMLPEVGPEKIRVDYRQDSLPLNAGLYEAFLANGSKGRDALLCYLHLLWTYRKQGTNKPWAVSEYLSRGLNLSPKRVRIARGLLTKMKLTEAADERDTRGRIIKRYTKLNLVSNPGPVRSTGAVRAPMEKTREFSTSAVLPHEVPVQQMLEERTRKRVRSKTRARNPEYTAFLRNYKNLYQEKNSEALSWNYGKDGARLKDDLKDIGTDRLTRAARLLFSDDCPREVKKFADRAGYSYGVFHSQLRLPGDGTRGLLAALDAEDRRLSLIRVCPGCHKANEHTGQECIYCGEPLKREAVNVGA